MDVFVTSRLERGLALEARVGGSPFNVAIGLARLSQSVAFLASISRDALGERLVEALGAEGVDTSAVARVDAPTTLAMIGLDATGVPKYTFHGEKGADRALATSDLARVPAGIRALHVGSYALVVEPIGTTIRALMQRGPGDLVRCCDVNVRLSVVGDAGRWRVALDALLPALDLLKLSAEDLSALAPGETAAAFAARAIAQGVGLVVLTLGPDGAVAWTPSGHVHVPAAPAPLVDTVGAGDSFQAALLTWLAEHEALNRNALGALDAGALVAALAFAARAAAFTCSRTGAEMPRRRDLRA